MLTAPFASSAISTSPTKAWAKRRARPDGISAASAARGHAIVRVSGPSASPRAGRSWTARSGLMQSDPFVESMNTTGGDDAAEQDQREVACRAIRNAGLAFRLPRVHGRDHGAPGLRRA